MGVAPNKSIKDVYGKSEYIERTEPADYRNGTKKNRYIIVMEQ